MRAILIIDHGSVRAEANEMLACMAALVQHLIGEDVIVEPAHMELAEPDIPTGFARCVERGATDIVAFPYMLSPGRHSTRDIPNLVAKAAESHPNVTHRTADAFGVHARLAELILERAGMQPARAVGDDDACRRWNPEGEPASCGAACPARSVSAPAPAHA